MNNSINIKFKDSLIFLFILIVFFAIGFIFYTEIIKNKKIRSARNNFYEVKKEFIFNLQKCSDESQEWNFGQITHTPKTFSGNVSIATTP